MYKVKYRRINSKAHIPEKSHEDDAGFDLFAIEDACLLPHEFACIPTGLCIELPHNTEAQIRPRSGLAAKHGITVLNTPGTVDAGYRGEVKVILINHSKEPFHITEGMRIAQMVIKPIYEVSFEETVKLEDSARGNDGFGSTG